MLDDPETLKLGPYLTVADSNLRLISVFDDLKYDRADADILSPAMRRHFLDKFAKLGFRQKTGTIVVNKATDVHCLMPKFHALGASPFDITRFTARREQDFYVLTPTQTACQFIDHYSQDEAVQRIRDLVQTQPINLYRLMDYLERKPKHQSFMSAIGHLRYVQRVAVESEPLCRRRALG
ncbi:MAG: hypothetical protein AAF748_13840 [Pseudomonadota bacterium]